MVPLRKILQQGVVNSSYKQPKAHDKIYMGFLLPYTYNIYSYRVLAM
jgi:hypothetical protein